MYYIKNTSEKVLIEPESGLRVNPGECKQFKDPMLFERFCAVFNGLCSVITENEYNRWIKECGYLGGTKKQAKGSAKEASSEVDASDA